MALCRDTRTNCVNDKNGCVALTSTIWILKKDRKCPFYISPEQHQRDMQLIKERVGTRRWNGEK